MTRLLSLLLILGLAACTADTEAPTDPPADTAIADAPDTGDAMGDAPVVVGAEIAEDAQVLPVPAVVEQAADLDGQTVAVEGTISKVCQVKGCWLTLATETGDTFRIVVPKDENGEYAFTFPIDVTGATAHVTGELAVETESVETQQHLARDEGQTEEEIEAITEPKSSIVLTASGARLVRA